MPQTPISTADQAAVLRRDRWLCHYCGAPVVFAPAMRMVGRWTADHDAPGIAVPAYYQPGWPREGAPLLDWIGAIVHRRVAESCGGGGDRANLVTACNRCFTTKGDTPEDEFLRAHPRRSRGGTEPAGWDGLSEMFLLLAADYFRALSDDEREWVAALRERPA